MVSRFLCGGLTTFDLAYFSDELPGPGAKGTAHSSYTDVGGPAANAAVTAAILGSHADLHSVFGPGMFADRVRETLAEYSVGVLDHGGGIALPVASVWIEATGERTILSTDNRRSEVEANLDLIAMKGVTAVLLDGHYPQLQLALADAAMEAGTPIVLDCGRWRPVFTDLLEVATDVIMTATFRPPDLDGSTDTDAILEIKDRYGMAVCAVTRGAESILVAESGGVREVPVPEVAVVDTTGAGDVLHGAYLHYRYGEGSAAVEALRLGGVAASNSCAAFGARRITDSE
jgi:sugar/nucleoside kinase (ribokinase family)